MATDANDSMNYEATIKMEVASPENAEQIAKRLRAVLEFGTIREVIGDALELETDCRLIDVAITVASPADAL